MDIKNSQQIDHNNRKLNNIYKIKPLYFLIIFISISTVFAFILGGYFIGKDQAKNEQESTTDITEQIKLDSATIPDNPENWDESFIESIGVSIKLPDSLSEKGEWKEVILEGVEGAIICLTHESLDSNDDCNTDSLIVSSTSNNFKSENEDDFVTVKGFSNESGKIFIIDSSNKKVELKNEKYKVLSSDNGYEVLKILGSEDSNITPGKNYLGAIINTNNKDNPSLILQMEIKGELSEYEFDQILESVNFNN